MINITIIPNLLNHERAQELNTLRVGRPLVYYMGQEEHPNDYQILIDTFVTSISVSNRYLEFLYIHRGHDAFLLLHNQPLSIH